MPERSLWWTSSIYFYVLFYNIKYINYTTLVIFFKALTFLKKAVANKWLNVIAKVVEDIKSHYTEQVNYLPVHFYCLLVFIIALLQNTLTQIFRKNVWKTVWFVYSLTKKKKKKLKKKTYFCRLYLGFKIQKLCSFVKITMIYKTCKKQTFLTELIFLH